MKFEEPIKGFVKYAEEDYPFMYEDKILQLFPSTRSVWKKERLEIITKFKRWVNSLNSNNEWIKNIYLYGKTEDNNDIVFCVNDDSSNNNGFISFPVIYCFKYDGKTMDAQDIQGFSVEGREVDYFYSPSRVFDNNIEITPENKISNVGINVVLEKERVLGEYKHKDVNIKMYAKIETNLKTNSKEPLFAKTKFKFLFSEPKDLEFVMDIYHHCKLFLYYVCKRTNIQLENINAFCKSDGKDYEYGYIKVIEDNCEENDLNRQKKIIKFEYLENGVEKIFADIENGNMYFGQMCSSIAENYLYNISRIILNFVAFEREYRNIYTDEITRSSEYYEIQGEIKDYLDELKEKNIGNKKKYLKDFIKAIERTENSYGARMKKALTDCEDIMLPFLRYRYDNYDFTMLDKISERMNKLRNDSAHGNIDLKIEPINHSDFAILEILIYVMRLKYMGIEKYKIQYAIRDLMNYNNVELEESS